MDQGIRNDCFKITISLTSDVNMTITFLDRSVVAVATGIRLFEGVLGAYVLVQSACNNRKHALLYYEGKEANPYP